MSHVLTRSPAIRHGENTIDWHDFRPASDPSQPTPAVETPGPAADPSGPTLADVVARAWEVLGAELPACCPVCGGELIPHAAGHAHAAGGRCQSCGSTLS
jgi:hypothetical protein